MRTPLSLALGLTVGIVGTVLFLQSFPPPAGSLEEKLDLTERDLAKTKVLLAAAEARAPQPKASGTAVFKDRARSIMEDVKDGKEVRVDDVFKATKPLLRDLNPIFERVHRRNLRRMHESVLAELTRKYKLNPAQQQAIKAWQDQKLEQDMADRRALIESDQTGMQDLIRHDRLYRASDGMDPVMASVLTGEEKDRYQKDRLTERANNVQAEADRRISRLNAVVPLDEQQQDAVFSIMARSSRDFDPSMQLEGVGADSPALPPGQSRDEAIMGILRPEQRQQYEENRIKRRLEAEQEMREMGLRMPPDWDPLADP
jgi:hypothetical protein